jgi:hypothetical protein
MEQQAKPNWIIRNMVGIDVGLAAVWLMFATTQLLLFLDDEGTAPVFGMVLGLVAASCFATAAVLTRLAQKRERARQNDE